MTSPRTATDLQLVGSIETQERASLPSAATWDSREAFHREVTPLIPRLYRLCLTLSRDDTTAEDLLQTSLVRAYVRREDFAGRGSFFGWLCQIVRNSHNDYCRTEARRRTIFEAAREGLEALTSVFVEGPDPEESVCEADSANQLLDCLRRIPANYSVVLLLCDVEDMTHQEAATALGVPLGTIKSRQTRGRKMLRKAYERRAGLKGAT